MTMHQTCDAPAAVPAPPTPEAVVADAGTSAAGAAEGWDALALAELGRPLTRAEVALTRTLPVEAALDRLFPTLSDPARQEALWALG